MAEQPVAVPAEIDISPVRLQRDEKKLEAEATPTVEATTLKYINSGGNFITGFDVNSEEALRQQAVRSKRFGLEPASSPGHGDTLERLKTRAERFGTTLMAEGEQPIKLVISLPTVPPGKVASFPGFPLRTSGAHRFMRAPLVLKGKPGNEATGDIRPEAIHLHGTDEMSSRDVFAYFRAYAPRNIEWINDSSCNVVWDDRVSAGRALQGVGRHPVALPEEFSQGKENKEGSEAAQDSSGQEEANSVRWWQGESHSKAKTLLLRFATTGDKKIPGAAKHSHYYMKYGNPNPQRTATEERDLRQQLDLKRTNEERPVEDIMEVDDPLLTLSKRPKPLHADRSEEEDKAVGGDLRKRIQQKRKRRDLQMRLGRNPRLIEKQK